MKSGRINLSIRSTLFGFIAGFVATLTFHQITVWLLRAVQIAPFSPYNMTATWPWSVPAVLSLALWAGVWGLVFASIQGRFPPKAGYWVASFLFGAIFPSLVALLLVAPLKGLSVGGWPWQLLLTVFSANGIWGLGTAILLKAMLQWPVTYHHYHKNDCPPGMTC